MKQQIINQTKAIVALAEEKFSVDLSNLTIEFTSAGRAAGQAGVRGFGNNRQFRLKFNLDAAEADINDMLYDTVPHEVAHLVCFYNPSYGKNHNSGWAAVCQALGGSGKRTHNVPVLKHTYREQYLYILPNGIEHIVKSAAKHNKIQMKGVRYTIRHLGLTYGRENFVGVISPEEHRRRHESEVMAARGMSSTKTEVPKAKPTPTKRPARRNGMTKIEECRALYSPYFSRQDNILTFVKSAGCTPAGAATYYAKIKKEQS